MRKFVIIDKNGRCTFHKAETDADFVINTVRYISSDIAEIYEVFDVDKKKITMSLTRDVGDENR